MENFTSLLRKALENTFRYGQGTKDMAGPSGLSTEVFIDKVRIRIWMQSLGSWGAFFVSYFLCNIFHHQVAWRLGRYVAATVEECSPQDLVIPSPRFRRNCTYCFQWYYKAYFICYMFQIMSIANQWKSFSRFMTQMVMETLLLTTWR